MFKDQYKCFENSAIHSFVAIFFFRMFVLGTLLFDWALVILLSFGMFYALCVCEIEREI